MFCGHCGKEIENGAKFCPYCGSKINNNNNSPVKENNKKPKALNIFVSFAFIVAVICAIAFLGGLLKKDNSAEKNTEPSIIYAVDADISDIEVGECIAFGTYEQDEDRTNGKEDIEWVVLDKEDTKIFVVSKYALDCVPYDDSKSTSVTWEECSLRRWLNNSFVNSAFNADEIKMILTVTVEAERNPYYNTNAGNNTEDRMFILSVDEASRYFGSDGDRKCQATKYAISKGCVVWADTTYCSYKLRNPGHLTDTAAKVYNNGSISGYGNWVGDIYDGVRPAMWIEIG